ncbi:MAG: hypothetical protein CVT67_03095 [Actinobacteria bacterium HGW-Actinobacteria-7]|nr:MAG: hypothetical protein CVT67_03095 [Actinobacteria bacterium HGW-Actinobacteria-7]
MGGLHEWVVDVAACGRTGYRFGSDGGGDLRTLMVWLGAAIPVVLGIAAIVVALFVAKRQAAQLEQLRAIGLDTRSTARKLDAEAVREEFVRHFFSLDEEGSRRYKCVVPVRYEQRPLPLIPAGDYNALHVLQGFLGQDRLDFWPVLMASEDGGVSAAEPLTRGDAVYLCSPQRNPALGRLAPALDLTDDTTPGIPAFDGIDLPCWFADDYRAWEHGGQVPDSPTKKLWICELKTAVSSEAERAYREAAGLAPGDRFDAQDALQSDSAIVLRLTDPEGIKTIVVAGIHQYGTWIASEFFCRLATDLDFANREVFVGEGDFVAIIWGEFNSATFAVERCGVHEEHLWVRQSGAWERVPQHTAATSRISA